jgi:hypothetical protein
MRKADISARAQDSPETAFASTKPLPDGLQPHRKSVV